MLDTLLMEVTIWLQLWLLVSTLLYAFNSTEMQSAKCITKYIYTLKNHLIDDECAKKKFFFCKRCRVCYHFKLLWFTDFNEYDLCSGESVSSATIQSQWHFANFIGNNIFTCIKFCFLFSLSDCTWFSVCFFLFLFRRLSRNCTKSMGIYNYIFVRREATTVYDDFFYFRLFLRVLYLYNKIKQIK